ncbi:MAG: flavin reductase family protein [Rhodospirillales bacterium]|jgi:3-hydroxy-9,10-secoandrosta-1,3,5(10)-triene-9,17-dione monooxygenase reductase component|nr:flavin reductase family protein [Rhodospirillales bacterium]
MPENEGMDFCNDTFRRVLGNFATGVTVVTGIMPDGRAVGMTVSAFTSVSMDPPLVSVCFAKSGQSLDAFVKGTHFTVNVLSDRQKEQSQHFARRAEDKFDGIDYRIGENGCPILPGSLAAVQCAREGVHDTGDHWLIIGRVEALDAAQSGEPLIHFRGDYRHLA